MLQAWYSQIWPNLGQIWVNFGPNGSFLNFRQKNETVIFFRLGFVQKIRRFQCAVFEKKCEKPLFLGILGQKGSNWAKKGPFSNFRSKSENVTFLPIFFYFSKQKIRKFQCAVSEKIWRTETTDRQTERDE